VLDRIMRHRKIKYFIDGSAKLKCLVPNSCERQVIA
jgi:hypothetical protein